MKDTRKAELKIINSRILAEDDLVEAGVAIEDGRIAKIGKDPNLPDSEVTINARGMLILPGVVDVHVHLRDLDLSYKEDFSSGTQAAVMGGVTTVLDMPNTAPRTANSERIKEKIHKAASEVFCNVGFFGELALEPSETIKMTKEGAIGFKLYLNEPRNAQLRNQEVFTKLIQPINAVGSTLAVHAEFPSDEAKPPTHIDKKREIDEFIRLHDPQLEISAVSECAESAKKSGVHIHICHISTQAALAIIRREKANGTPLTVEATPHHLLLSEQELYRQGSYAKMVPPLRKLSDTQSLFQGVASGIVDAIASDHAPHSNLEKDQDFASAPSGIPGLETILPLILTEVTKGTITLKRAMKAMCEIPPRLFGLKGRGIISEGYHADLVLVDLHEEKTIHSRGFFSKAKYTPFEGRKVKGIPVSTIVNGIPMVQDGELVGKPGSGRILKPINQE